MWTPTLVLIAITTLAACITLGGGLYEFLVVDPAWPKRPGIIQLPKAGGGFWVPATVSRRLIATVRRDLRSPMDPPQPTAPAARADHMCGDARGVGRV